MTGNRFYKGRTDNHLTWVMVDATDFATPESALSAATKIKIYAKLRGATGTNFVSSGTGSLTNDITHVGASVLGIYTIALVKADLSDASAAWYDQYIISLSATGAAYQTLIVDGGIDDSVMQVAASRVLVNQSAISDLKSQLSDLASDLKSYLVVMSGVQSDIYSLLSDTNSDLASKIGAITVTIGASDVSDIASAVIAGMTFGSTISDIYSLLSDFKSDFQSRVPKLVATNSQLSDLASDLRSFANANYQTLLLGEGATYSAVSDMMSDFQSRVPKRVATQSQLSDLASDVKSAVAGISISASDTSDILSALAAIKAKTDPLTYTIPNVVDANIQRVNDVTVLGDGAGTPWGP